MLFCADPAPLNAAECAYEIDEAASQGRQSQAAFCARQLLAIMQRCLEVRVCGGGKCVKWLS